MHVLKITNDFTTYHRLCVTTRQGPDPDTTFFL